MIREKKYAKRRRAEQRLAQRRQWREKLDRVIRFGCVPIEYLEGLRPVPIPEDWDEIHEETADGEALARILGKGGAR